MNTTQTLFKHQIKKNKTYVEIEHTSALNEEIFSMENTGVGGTYCFVLNDFISE